MQTEMSIIKTKFPVPSRAPIEWQEDAPEFVIDCFDNRGATDDRYKIFLGGSVHEPNLGRNAWYLGLSDAPDSPDGLSLWDDCDSTVRPLHQRVRWLDLPEEVRAHVVGRVNSAL